MNVRTTGSKPAEKHRGGAIACKKPVGAFEFGTADEDVFAPAFKHHPAALGGYIISDRRPDIAAQRARRRDTDQVRLSNRDQIAGERHDDLRRERDACGFDRHEKYDAKVSGGGNDFDDPGCKRRNELVNHYSPKWRLGKSASRAPVIKAAEPGRQCLAARHAYVQQNTPRKGAPIRVGAAAAVSKLTPLPAVLGT